MELAESNVHTVMELEVMNKNERFRLSEIVMKFLRGFSLGTPIKLVCLFFLTISAQAQLKPIGHALRVTFDVKPENKIDASFQSARFSFAVWDYQTTVQMLPKGICQEENPILGKHPSNTRIVLSGLGFHIAISRLDKFLQVRIDNKEDKIAASAILNLPLAVLHGVAAHNNEEHCL